LVESAFRFSWLFEHDLFRKPVSTLGSSPRAGFFGIMLPGIGAAATGRNNEFQKKIPRAAGRRQRRNTALTITERRPRWCAQIAEMRGFAR
jgi:hypothetical protein